MEGFVRLNKTVNNKGEFIPLSTLKDRKKLYNEYISKDDNADWYNSLYIYSDEGNEYFSKNNSISGYPGIVSADYLFFDLDSKDNLEKARLETVELLKNLKKQLGVEVIDRHVNVYFSGKKGFHIFLHTEQIFNSDDMKHYCSVLAKGIKTFDEKPYDKARLIRINGTKHQESGLYKIELTVKEVSQWDCEKIKETAKKRRKALNKDLVKLDVSEYIENNKNTKIEKESVIIDEEIEEIEGVRGLDKIDFSKCPQDTPRCIYALLQGIMVPGMGERHHIFLHLGNFLRNKGNSKEHVFSILSATSELNYKLYPEHQRFSDYEIRNSVLTMVFRNGAFNKGGWGISPEDSIFAKYCKLIENYSKLECKMHNKQKVEVDTKQQNLKEVDTSAVVKIEDVSKIFSDYAENFDRNIVKTGIKSIDEHMDISAGTMNLIVGASGSGKTSLCLNILEKANALGIDCMFFSLDMIKQLLYLKLAMKLTDFSKDDILNIYKDNDLDKKKVINDTIAKKYNKTYFDFTGTLTADDMRDRILATEEATGKKIKLVLVDYASRIAGPFNDAYSNAKHNALRMKDIADETSAAWMIICQISRSTGDGSTPLRTKRAAKDAGDWEEAASNVITCWRPFMGLDRQEVVLDEGKEDEHSITCDDKVMRLFLAKNRMGRELEIPLKWNGAKSLVEDMDDEEKLEYMEELGQYEDKIRKTMFLRK